ncbi:MAG: PEP-CTERM sorting domain-containing protein [Planctomycetota bacterium]
MKTLKMLSIAAVITTFVLAATVSAGTVVAPAGFATTDATFAADSPLGDPDAGSRYQQIYDASLFGQLPIVISEIQFRAASPENAFRPNSVSVSDSRISLSTTMVTSDPGATAAGNFSAAFDANVGVDELIVFDGPLTLDRGGSNPSGPQPFSYGFALETPFIYNPQLGNLLLDVQVPTGATVALGPGFGALEDFDASTASGDGTASVRGSVGSTVGAAGQTGLVTQFTFQPVPEPASALLLLTTSLAAIMRRR